MLASHQFDLNGAVGKLLLRMGVEVQTEMRKRVAISAGPYRVRRTRTTAAGPAGSTYTAYSRPSKPGEYLRKRTGHLQEGIRYTPTTAAAVGAEGAIRIGYLKNVFYGALWETRGRDRRKGLLDLVQQMLPRLRVISMGAS